MALRLPRNGVLPGLGGTGSRRARHSRPNAPGRTFRRRHRPRSAAALEFPARVPVLPSRRDRAGRAQARAARQCIQRTRDASRRDGRYHRRNSAPNRPMRNSSMKKYTLALSVLCRGRCAHADGDVTKSGTMRIDAGAERASTAHIACSSDRDGGALYFEITVPEANTKKDFGYDDFEGPDAKPGALSHVEWIGPRKQHEVTSTASGSYIRRPGRRIPLRDRRTARDARARRRRCWPARTAPRPNSCGRRSSYDKSRRTLVATFAFDAEESAHVRDTVKACLPASK